MMLLPTICAFVLNLTGFQMPNANPYMMQADPIMILQRGEVRKELKLSKDQSHSIDQVYKESMGMGSRTSDPNDMGVAMDSMNRYKESSEKAVAVLDDGQKARFHQIRYQMLGPVSLSEPEVQKALNLTADQNTQVSKIRDDASSDFMEAMQHPSRGTEGKFGDISKKEAEKLLALLTDEQKTKLNELYGPEFKKAKPPHFFPM